MTVYVDEMRVVPMSGKWHHPKSCHMMADTDVELERMARRINLREEGRHKDHYDLTRSKRVLALYYGAVQVSIRKLIQLRKMRMNVPPNTTK